MQNLYLVIAPASWGRPQKVYAFSASEAKFICYGKNVPKGTIAKKIG